MIVLAIDTAGINCSAGLYDASQGGLLAVESETLGKGHAERLTGMIDEVFRKSKATKGDVSRIGVTIGPGSFTGIRVGVAAARGLALALSVPAIGVSTLEVLAAGAFAAGAAGPVIAAVDAKRGELFMQLFSAAGDETQPPLALTIDEARAFVAAQQAKLIGSGAAVLAGMSAEADQFDIATVASIAAARAKATGKPAPLYLRGPDAKPQAGFAIERRA